MQRISLNDVMLHNAQIGISTETKTDNLLAIETLALALAEATKFAKQLNENIISY